MKTLQLFLLGFLTLLLELVFIRFLAGSIWNLGYFPNLVLMAVFLGMSIGFVFHERIPNKYSETCFAMSALLAMGLVLFVVWFRPTFPGFDSHGGEVGGEVFFSQTRVDTKTSDFVAFGLWFSLIVVIFALISQRTAKMFREFIPLRAYSIDIFGAATGILYFMLMSWFELPAYIWFVSVLFTYVAVSDPRAIRNFVVTVVSLVVIIGISWKQDQAPLAYQGPYEHFEANWSPYQKVEYLEAKGVQYIFVNGILHQAMTPRERLERSIYSAPHRFREYRKAPPYKNVLVIGAGSGNDVAAALTFHAEHIDAAEIDPVIALLGKKYHTLEPYKDPRVHLIVDDARAFLTRTDRKYDLIVYALTDSLVKVSPMSQLRLENYIFTKESVARAWNVLSDHGEILFYNWYRQDWLQKKLRKMIHEATGRWPITLSHKEDFWSLLTGKDLEATETIYPFAGEIATDNWPFLYLQHRGIPSIYIKAMGLLTCLVLSLLWMVERTSRKTIRKENSSLFLQKIAYVFMGIAFMLLETKSVIQFSLLFGTTWWNNSLVFLGILLLILAANAICQRGFSTKHLPWVMVGLVGTCLLGILIPLARLLAIESLSLRFVAAALLTFTPIFFGNLMFSSIFRDQKEAEHLFGWNLLGATLGGVVEYSSMYFGYRALGFVVMICYILVFVALSQAKRLRQVPQIAEKESALANL